MLSGQKVSGTVQSNVSKRMMFSAEEVGTRLLFDATNNNGTGMAKDLSTPRQSDAAVIT